MADALIHDLHEDGRCSVQVVREARLPQPLLAGVDWRTTCGPADALAELAAACVDTALAWIVAPETDGVLESLTRTVAPRVPIAGASADAVAVAASKTRTAETLALAGVPVVTCRSPHAPPPEGLRRCRWVVKPDDGAGCETTFLAAGWAEAVAIAGHGAVPRPVLQPYLEGEALSLSCIAARTGVRVVGINRQRVTIVGGALRFEGVAVGLSHSGSWSAQWLAQRVAAAIPGLRGWFGIDLVAGDEGPCVLEVNPRLTTAYAGLRALGLNAAALVLDDFEMVAPRCAEAADVR
jgi:predicted ATP-grasp superfamily ATP-dependent carboligase